MAKTIKELYNSGNPTKIDMVFDINLYDININNEKEWRSLIINKEISYSKIGSLIFDGIPSYLRSRIYQFLIKEDTSIDYVYFKSLKSDYEHQIDVDVQRTFRKHFLYSERYGPGQCRLFNILVAYSNYEPKIGYCQGMSYIAGILLLYFSELKAFKILAAMFKKNKLETLFDKNLSKLKLITLAQEYVFEEYIPKIYKHFKREKMPETICCGWYLTLFTRFKLSFVLRVWDLLIFYDFSILTFLTAAILKYYEYEILIRTDDNLIEFINNIEKEDINIDTVLFIMKNMLKFKDKERIRLFLGIE